MNSILGQTFEDFELILVDDGSKDATGEVARGLSQKDHRIVLVTGEGRGIARALQLGLARCRAPYIARMDADDEALPQRLERSIGALEADPSLAGAGTQVEIFREDQPVSPNMRAYGTWLSSLTTPQRLFHDRYVESPLCHPSVVLRREALDSVGGWEDGDFPEDYQLWLKLLHAGWCLRAVEPVLLRWRDGPSRLTRTDGRYSLASQLELKVRFLSKELNAREVWLWGAGEVGLRLSRLLLRAGVELRALYDVDAKKIGQRIEGLPVRSFQQLERPAKDVHLLAAVAAKGARAEIRGFLQARGFIEGEHFTCVA